MEAKRLFNAYRETRISITQDPTVIIRLPTVISAANFSGVKQHKFVSGFPDTDDEISFRRKHLAIASSIFHRNHFQSPRSFLWRVLENGKVFSICIVDISIQGNPTDAYVNLRFVLPNPILPTCVALSDSKQNDVISVFLLTEAKEIWTLRLRPDFFLKASNMDENIMDWCNIYSPKSLGIKSPHRLVALGADELLISFHDGALVKLESNLGADGLLWKEQQYNEGGWSHSFRSMVPFQSYNGVYYGGQYIQPSTATSIGSPITMIGGLKYVFTVTIDHRLRIWNLNLGKIAYTGDILTQEPEPQEEFKKLIDPSQYRLVQVISDIGGNTLCVTYSPLGSGEFKLWDIILEDDGEVKVLDLLPDNSLTPQAPSSDIWTATDFAVIPDKTCKYKMTIWVLWKNNVTYQLHKLEFLASSTVSHVRNTWSLGWEAVALDNLGDIPAPTILLCDPSDVTDKWLEFFLFPGRFSVPTLETGLAIYEHGLGLEKNISNKSKSLADRMCSLIASNATLTPCSESRPGFDQFRSATQTQWMRFYRLLVDLHEQRGEAMSLAIDPKGEMPWVVLADGVSAIRDCSRLEKIWLNSTSDRLEKYERVQTILLAAINFRNLVPENFVFACKSLLREEIHQESCLSTRGRIQNFYEKCDFANQIGDEEYDELLRNLGGHLNDINSQVYTTIVKLMSPSEGSEKNSSVLPLTEFGNKILVKGVQQIVELHRFICVDQLILLVFIENEVSLVDEGIQLETASIFDRLISILARLELIYWLTSTQISLTTKKTESSSPSNENSNQSKKNIVSTETVTVFEGVLRHLFGFDLWNDQKKMSTAVTKILGQICAPNSRYEISPAVIQCFLLKHERPDLAMEFSRFAESDSFSTYVQGRAYLAANDTLAAATLFKKAAVGMAFPNPKQQSSEYRSAGYLTESEKILFNAGIFKYYSHIATLFQRVHFYSYVADFAQLSLQFLKSPRTEDEFNLRNQMHNRLFNAALHTSRYELAYSVLTLFIDTLLQYSSLQTLITKMCETSNTSRLLKLPFIGLQDQVDEILHQKCHNLKENSTSTIKIPYYKILYAWRIKRNDFRGAALILMERLVNLQKSKDVDQVIETNQLESPLTQQYITIINTLSCVDSKHAWVLLDNIKTTTPPSPPSPSSPNSPSFDSRTSNPNHDSHWHQPLRQLVTLSDVRNAYQAELDRLAAIHNNQFTLEAAEAMDIL